MARCFDLNLLFRTELLPRAEKLSHYVYLLNVLIDKNRLGLNDYSAHSHYLIKSNYPKLKFASCALSDNACLD